MSKTPQRSLPSFGHTVPGEGGILGAILRGNIIAGTRQPDYALIVAPDDLGPLAWGQRGKDVTGANSLTDGLANTAAMAAAGCASAKAVHGISINGHSDWHIPARGEMWALRANVPELFKQQWYWTSTQGVAGTAVAQSFRLGTSDWYDKGYEVLVRPVRSIQL